LTPMNKIRMQHLTNLCVDLTGKLKLFPGFIPLVELLAHKRSAPPAILGYGVTRSSVW
jgi:hypothetical protein